MSESTTEKSLWQYLGLALSGALLLIVIALAAAVIVVPKLAGAIPLTVLTSSMKPTLPPGTLVIVSPVEPDDLRVGDVATYQIESGRAGVITHRITSIASTSDGSREFTLKGDNNSAEDPDPVIEDQIQGRVWYSLPLLGWVNNAVNGQGSGWIIPALAIALFGYAGYSITSGIVGSARRRRAVGAAVGADDSTAEGHGSDGQEQLHRGRADGPPPSGA